MKHELHLGDCLDVLKTLPENSVDSIVTDPPYGLSFMGKKWDYDVPSVEIWKECLRVLKPGGYLLAFAGTRTQHRMAVRIEDAGFEIRDMLAWVFGSGFPKSLDVGKAVDKLQGNERENIGIVDSKTGVNKNTNWKCSSPRFYEATKGTSEWEGWGTALKPALEPITLARKPLSEKTVAENVLKWGTGGINIDACRVGVEERTNKGMSSLGVMHDDEWKPREVESNVTGRFPANLIHDGSDEVLSAFPDAKGQQGDLKNHKREIISPNGIYGKQPPRKDAIARIETDKSAARFFYCPKTSKKDRNEGCENLEDKYYAAGNQAKAELKRGNVDFNANKGKDKNERHNHNQVGVSKNNHPTVKPTELMLYLIKLVTKPEGTTLDPFMGSGSTGKAAARGNFKFIGIEREQDFYNIAQARITHEAKKPKQQTFEF